MKPDALGRSLNYSSFTLPPDIVQRSSVNLSAQTDRLKVEGSDDSCLTAFNTLDDNEWSANITDAAKSPVQATSLHENIPKWKKIVTSYFLPSKSSITPSNTHDQFPLHPDSSPPILSSDNLKPNQQSSTTPRSFVVHTLETTTNIHSIDVMNTPLHQLSLESASTESCSSPQLMEDRLEALFTSLLSSKYLQDSLSIDPIIIELLNGDRPLPLGDSRREIERVGCYPCRQKKRKSGKKEVQRTKKSNRKWMMD